ncbi:HIST1-L10 [Ovibos moschatus]
MSETAPAAPADQVLASMDKPQARNRVKKPVGLTGVNRKTASTSVSKLITEALSVSQERAGISLAALKKALSAAGYHVERNSRIKLGLKGLVSKGILVQTRGTGASGSSKLSKKAAPELSKGKVKKPSAKSRKLVLSRDSKSPKNGKANKRAKKPRTTAAQIAARNGGKTKRTKCKQRKSPAQARAGNPKTGKPKLTQQETNTRKATTKK